MGLPRAVQEMQESTDSIQGQIQQQSFEGKTDDNRHVPASNNSNPKPEPQGNGSNKSQTVSRDEFEALDKRYRAYKKMYDTEVHGFRTSLSEKDAQIDQLKGEVKTLKESIEGMSNSGGDDSVNENLDAIRDEFGPQFVDAVGNLSRSQLMRENGKLISRIENLEKAIGSGQQAQSRNSGQPETTHNDSSVSGQAFFSRLRDLVPDWQVVNEKQGFRDFLDLPDENGYRRQDNLSKAQRTGNVIEVARHFLDYADYLQAHRSGTSGDYLPSGSNGGGSSLGFEDDEVIYEDELDEYYRDVALRKFSDEEIAQYEVKISRAMERGLIRPRPRR